MVNKIANQINKNIENSFPFPIAIHGISEAVMEIDNKGNFTYPLIISNDGEGKYPFIDDNYPFGCYHKLISKTYSKMPGFGDSDIDVEQSELMLVAWGFRSALRMSAEQVQSKIILPCIPQEAQILQVRFDKIAIFNSEFRNVPFKIKPETFLFTLSYRIQYKFERDCIKNCNCK